MLVPSDRLLVPLGDLDPADAAPLTDAGLTPYHAVKRSLPLLIPGSTAVAIGAGGLGHMAVQLLKALSPATVIAVDQRKEALRLAADVGADHGVLAGEDAAAEITELTRGKGADVVVDLVGADATLALAAAVTRPMGHVTLVGIAGGSLPVSFFGIAYEVSVASTYWGSLPELMEVIALASTGRIRAHVQRFALDDALLAYESHARRRSRGPGRHRPVVTRRRRRRRWQPGGSSGQDQWRIALGAATRGETTWTSRCRRNWSSSWRRSTTSSSARSSRWSRRTTTSASSTTAGRTPAPTGTAAASRTRSGRT